VGSKKEERKKGMAEGYLDITPELLCEICKGLEAGERPRYYHVAKHGLPADARVVRCEPETIRMVIESAEIENGARLPAPVLGVVFDDGAAERAWRELREAWFNRVLRNDPHEREWENDEAAALREQANARKKERFDAQTQEILSGTGSPPIAPRCPADMDTYSGQ
jgi:hypothetical protein